MWDSLCGESLYLPINCKPKTALEKIKFYCFKKPVLCGTSYLHGILFVCLPQQNISQDFVSSLKGPRAYNYAWSERKVFNKGFVHGGKKQDKQVSIFY